MRGSQCCASPRSKRQLSHPPFAPGGVGFMKYSHRVLLYRRTGLDRIVLGLGVAVGRSAQHVHTATERTLGQMSELSSSG